MAIREIVTMGDSTLRKVCRPVTDFNAKLHRVLDDMLETVVDANGAGLAAPQIGLMRRICLVLDEENEQFIELINPEIVSASGEQTGIEGCLSVPGKYGLVKRPYYAKVRAQDRNGDWYEAEGEELIARCFCHELDHLDGIIYTQVMERYLTEEELQFDEE